MHIKTTKEEGITVLTPLASVHSATAAALQEAFDELLGQGEQSFIVDLSHAKFISSAGLRAFIKAAKKLHGQGCLAVCHANANVQEIFALARLEALVKKYDSLENAAAFLNPEEHPGGQ